MMKYKFRTKNFECNFALLCFVILCLFVSLPQFRVYFPMVAVCTGIICILTVLMLRKRQKRNRMEWLYFILAAVFFLYTVTAPSIWGYNILRNRYIALMPMVWMYLLYGYLRDVDAIRGGWSFMIFFSVITMIRTCKALLVSPYISRLVKTSGEITESILKQGVGDYSFIYLLMFLCIIFFWLFLEEHRKRRFGYLFLAAMGEITIILSNYMMALVLSILGIGVLFGFWIYRKNKALFFILLLICLLLLLFYKPIFHILLEKMLPFIPPGKTFDRLQQVYMSLYGEGIGFFEEFMMDRVPVFAVSFKSIIKYPVFGVICGHLTKTNGYYNEFGQHSFVFDTMAVYGIVWGILLIILISYPFFAEGRMKGKKKELPVAIYVVTLLLLCFNNATFSMALVLYIIYPYVYDRVCKREEEKYVE